MNITEANAVASLLRWFQDDTTHPPGMRGRDQAAEDGLALLAYKAGTALGLHLASADEVRAAFTQRNSPPPRGCPHSGVYTLTDKAIQMLDAEAAAS